MAVCAAIIGKDNSPKFFATINPDEELHFQYKVLSSLDVVEEKLNSGLKSGADMRELYLGMLLSLETHKIYGYVTNTKIKFIIVIDSTNMAIRDNEIRSMFRKIHSEYADIVSNPFYIPGEPISSKAFTSNIKSIMTGTV
ncbi:trafficking protein particle complex subunit 2-like protein [Diabrotica virgifera virgifera]|uniref:Trafficking protein particle complex subunit 2-like protein n=2 Tax=Diabrotica TaxID=50385 RepID=A0A6P7G5H2_DIAVI|nr:trafficking protein particle complex subunit 2-like protein [Diabrotica virgifera virgifera]